MIDTAFLHPPGFGPKANPLLFGVAEGLLRLFPLPENASVPPGLDRLDHRAGTLDHDAPAAEVEAPSA